VGEFVRFEVDGGIGTIRLDRPPMNALNAQVQGELHEAATEAGTRADVRAVVIYGGAKVFAAGADIKEMVTADFRICRDNAKLGQPEILLGIIPGAGGTQRLPRLVGPAKAKDLVYSGRFVGAEEALAIGLVDKVVAPDDVYSAAVELVSRYVTGPALALRAAKAAIDGGLDGDLASGLRLETQLFTGLFATEDRAIGMASFVENGPGKAQFVGR